MESARSAARTAQDVLGGLIMKLMKILKAIVDFVAGYASMSTISLVGALNGMSVQDHIIYYSVPLILLVLMQIKPIKRLLSGEKER